MKKILILSGKGGTGKTTTAAAFIKFHNAAAVADCDVDAPNLHIIQSPECKPVKTEFMGAEKAVTDSEKCSGCGLCLSECRFDAIKMKDGKAYINEFACEGCGVCSYLCPEKAISMNDDTAGERYLYKDDRVFSTARLRMGRGNSGKLVAEVKKSMEENAPDTDIAIIDGSPGIGCPVISSISGVDLVLIVSEPSLSGISDLKRILKTTRTFDTKACVCINRWNTSPENTEAIENFLRENEVPFAGRIPYDSTASAAVNEGKSVADTDCPAGRALKDVYKKVLALL